MVSKKEYNPYTKAYIDMIESENDVLYRKLLIPELLKFIWPVSDLRVLDAGCGEERISRLLFDRGACVTAIDVANNFIDAAKQRAKGREISFHCYDICQKLPDDLQNALDLIVSNLVIDDLQDYQGYIKNLCIVAKEKASIITKNNPYSAVSRGKVDGCFDTGACNIYQGMDREGINVSYYHRTLPDHVNEFSDYGFFLSKMSDLQPTKELLSHEDVAISDKFKRYLSIPFLMILKF